MKTAGRILILVTVLYLAGIPAYLASKTNSMTCAGIRVEIADSSDYYLVTKREIRNLIISGNARIIGAPLREISPDQIEQRIAELRELKTSEVYFTVDGFLNVFADQRNPIMRVIAGGGDYFVDEDGVVFRRKKLYTPRLHIAEGNIRITPTMLNGVSVLDTSIRRSILKDLWKLVGYIRSDGFWSSQIDQVYVDNDDEIVLIPRLGNHKIHLGTIENYEGKLRNLGEFYRKVLPEVGWNRYDLINLEFRDQIVCRRR